MNRARVAVIVVAAVAVLAAALVSHRGGHKGNRSGSPASAQSTKPRRGDLRIVFAYSPEKEKLLLPLIDRYNRERHRVGARRVFIEGQNWSSGKAEAEIASGRFKPVAWSPASSLWGRLLDFQVGRRFVPDENPSIVRTPLVIAMWQPEAVALGWPKRQTSWAQILRMATGPANWSQFGLPTYGAFRFGHTNPDFSTSGLDAVAAEYYALTGKKEGETVADTTLPRVRQGAQQIESSVVHYGDTTLFFEDQLKAHGPAYASAVAMEEATLVDYNETRPKGAEKLVAEYPADGTFFSDDPYITLDAPWVSVPERTASDAFGKWLVKAVTPRLAAQFGFRPGRANPLAISPLDRSHGVLLSQPALVLALPEPKVLARIKAAWHADRKPADIELVVDVSGSMQDENKIGQARRGLVLFLKQLSPRDRVGLLYFNGALHDAIPIAQYSNNRASLRRTVTTLIAGGNTALYDAVNQGVADVRALRDNSRINAVVVLTDGQDTASRLELPVLLTRLQARSESEGEQIRIFTIAYGSSADRDVLARIADLSGGKPYVGDPSEIESIYLQISSFF